MNTFLPFANFRASAVSLDSVRLRNQLNECKVIQAALSGAKAWAHHPATLMWSDWPNALRMYMRYLAEEMDHRGISVPDWATGNNLVICDLPIWFGYPAFHESHRRNLLRKNYEFYKKRFPSEQVSSDVYAWPTKVQGAWIIRFKTVGAKSYQERTEPIKGVEHALKRA